MLHRRAFLGLSAAAVMAPAVVRAQGVTDVDVAVVGAGAAGIAAALKVAAANRKVVVIEADDRIGGRCVTDTRTFGVPFDRGARWIHAPDTNPVARAVVRAGIDIYGAPPGQKVRIGRRYAREGEMEDYLSALARARRAIDDASRRADVSCAQALPKDLGDWQRTVEFVLGPWASGKDVSDLSSADLTRAADRDVEAFSRLGFGALVAKLGERLPVRLSTPVTRINWGNRWGVDIQTPRGEFAARAVIVTVSTAVLTAGRIQFNPAIGRQMEAASRLSLGSYDHIALDLPGNPLGLQRDDLVFEQAAGVRTGALLANLSGSTLCTVDVGGRFGRDLAAQGEKAMIAFALDWLDGLYGTSLKSGATRAAATRWNAAPYVMGAFSAAAPGGAAFRRVLMEGVGGRLWFAGEAAHETLWGTVGGAWDSGERAANEALKAIGAVKEPAPAQPAPPPQQRKRRKKQS